MKYTFKLKEPNSKKETLILFSCYFKDENKRFIYSTGENVNPKNGDAENKCPFKKGSNKTNVGNPRPQLDDNSTGDSKPVTPK